MRFGGGVVAIFPWEWTNLSSIKPLGSPVSTTTVLQITHSPARGWNILSILSLSPAAQIYHFLPLALSFQSVKYWGRAVLNLLQAGVWPEEIMLILNLHHHPPTASGEMQSTLTAGGQTTTELTPNGSQSLAKFQGSTKLSLSSNTKMSQATDGLRGKCWWVLPWFMTTEPGHHLSSASARHSSSPWIVCHAEEGDN